MEHDLILTIFGKRKIVNFDPYNVLLAIATNIPVRLMKGVVFQGHKLHLKIYQINAVLVSARDFLKK